MDCDVTERGGFAIVALSGDIDFNSSPRARSSLLNLVEQKRDLVVDLGAVAYIDSSGVASLIEAYQQAKMSGTRFSLANVGGSPMRVLQLARLDKVFQIYDSVDAAVSGAG